MDNLKLDRAILHILDNNHDAPIFSVKELEVGKDVSEFLEKHIYKVFSDADLKNAYFNSPNNIVFNLCKELSQNTQAFDDVALQLTNKLFTIIKEHTLIPSADVVFAIFQSETSKYFAIIKFNYKSSYIHYVLNSEEGNVNTLIKQKTTLPNETQKVEECVLIDLHTLEVKLLEKQYEINGVKEYYLTKYFLECDSQLSNAQKLKIINKTVSKLSKKHFNEDFNRNAQLKTCVAKSIAEENEIHIEKVAQAVFGDSYDVKKEYVEEVRKAGLVENIISLDEANATSKKFITQKLKTDNGIEINFPSHLYENKDIIEFINNPDGTISILIKNVNKVVNK